MKPVSLIDSLWYVCAFAIVAVCGALNLYLPYSPDQAIAMLAAMSLDAGGTLYVDFWDNKMPGLFWFYRAAGELFGYTEFGSHCLEYLWMLGFAVVVTLGLRRYYDHRWLASVPAVAFVGAYFATADPFQLTQLETLIGLPVFTGAYFAVAARTHRPSRVVVFGFLSGLCAGVTVCFKLVYAPVFVVFWCITTGLIIHDRPRSKTRMLLCLWIPVSLAVGLVISTVVAKFYFDGALAELLWTAFEYPPAALEFAPPAPFYRIVRSAGYFIACFATWSVFIAIGVAHWWQADRANPFTLCMIGWTIVAVGLIFIQKFSWWSYHFYLLFPPAGILAVRGVDVCAGFLYRNLTMLNLRPMSITLLLVIPCVGALLLPASQKMDHYVHIFLRHDGDLETFHAAINPTYERIRKSTKFLREKGARRGPIYVFGDPLYYYLSGRRPAAAVIGFPWDYFLDSQLRKLPEQLSQSRPAYIYIESSNARDMNRRQQGVPQFIGRHYTEISSDATGGWYAAKATSWQ